MRVGAAGALLTGPHHEVPAEDLLLPGHDGVWTVTGNYHRGAPLERGERGENSLLSDCLKQSRVRQWFASQPGESQLTCPRQLQVTPYITGGREERGIGNTLHSRNRGQI